MDTHLRPPQPQSPPPGRSEDPAFLSQNRSWTPTRPPPSAISCSVKFQLLALASRSTTGRLVAYQPRTPSTPGMRCSSKMHFVRKSPNCSLCLIVKAKPLPRKSRRHPRWLFTQPVHPQTLTGPPQTSQISSTTLSRPDRADCATSSTASLSRPSPVLCADASPPTPIIYASHNPGHSVARSAMSSRCRSAVCIIGRSIATVKEQHWWSRVGIDPVPIADKLWAQTHPGASKSPAQIQADTFSAQSTAAP